MKECVVYGFNASRAFDVKDWNRGGKEKIFENSKLETLLAEDSCPTQEELAKLLAVTQQAISKRLRAMGIIQKEGNCILYESKPKDVAPSDYHSFQLMAHGLSHQHLRSYEEPNIPIIFNMPNIILLYL